MMPTQLMLRRVAMRADSISKILNLSNELFARHIFQIAIHDVIAPQLLPALPPPGYILTNRIKHKISNAIKMPMASGTGQVRRPQRNRIADVADNRKRKRIKSGAVAPDFITCRLIRRPQLPGRPAKRQDRRFGWSLAI
jgi:hypothetical protein